MPFSLFLRTALFLFYALLFVQTAKAQPAVMDSFFTESNLKKIVYELADDSLMGRYTNSAGAEQAATIIAGRMQAAGLRKVKGMNGYYFDMDSSFANVRNVIGALPGSANSGELVIVSAHYDHLGAGKSTSWQAIFNGANDDASGVAVMLSLAAWFATRPVERTLLFIAFSGEEVGFLGSRGASQALVPAQIMAQINLEMLGRPGVYKRPFVTGHQHSNLRDLLNQALKDTLGINNYFEKDNAGGHLFQRSDNYPFAKLGVPAHTIMLTTDKDYLYHTVDDDPNTLDYKRMAVIAKNIALAIEPLVQGKSTPERISLRHLPRQPSPDTGKGNYFIKRKPR